MATATQISSTSDEKQKQEADEYIRSLLNKNLRIHTTDGRIFVGSFKCTDPDCNLVLAFTYEYRHPSVVERQKATAAQASQGKYVSTVKIDMISRYLGLVVVPGEHISKVELEEFASQMRHKDAVGLAKPVDVAT